MKSVCVHSHAKVNFYLDVVRRRRDGYHNIETLFQTISLADTLVAEVRPSELTMECSNPTLECGPSNLVLKAAEVLRQETGCRVGAHMNLAKRVPVAAGLAGGSGNAAAALVALDTLWRLNLPNARLSRLALALGSDVPYCLEGGTVAATGRGERMCKLNPVPESWLVLVHPPLAVSTRAVYTSPLLHISEERPFAGRTPSFRRAIRSLERGDISSALRNTMERVAFAMHPELEAMVQRLRDEGCTAAAMSGSGPTLFGVCDDRAHAEKIAASLTGLACTVTHTVSQALRVEYR